RWATRPAFGPRRRRGDRLEGPDGDPPRGGAVRLDADPGRGAGAASDPEGRGDRARRRLGPRHDPPPRPRRGDLGEIRAAPGGDETPAFRADPRPAALYALSVRGRRRLHPREQPGPLSVLVRLPARR